MPPLQEHSKVLQNLEKISLTLCEGLGNMSRFNSSQSSLKLPIMRDFILDHCYDLEELPPGIYDTSSVEKWSITSCHLLSGLSLSIVLTENFPLDSVRTSVTEHSLDPRCTDPES